MRFSSRLLLAFVVLVAARPAAGLDGTGALTLEDCLRLALENSRQLSAARHRRDAAEAELTLARAAGAPQLTVASGYLRLEDPPELSLPGVSLSLGRSNAFFADLGIEQPIYTGGTVAAASQAAEAGREAAGAAYDALAEETALEVVRAFYEVLAARELVRVRRASLEQLESHLEATRNRFRQGAASEYEALRAEVELTNRLPDLVRAENGGASAGDRLTRLLGLDPRRPIDVAGELPEPYRESVGSAPSGERAERVAAAARQEAARAEVLAQRGTRRPTVSWLVHLFATSPEYFLANDADPGLNAVGGLVVRFPVLDGGGREARILRAEAAAREASDLAKDLDLQLALEERVAQRRLAEAEAILVAQGEVIKQAEKALQIARVRYESGLGIELEVTDAQLALAEAQVVRVEALAKRAIAMAELHRARGETLLPPRGG